MAFKINISDKGRTFHLETDSEEIIGKKIGDKISGTDISRDLLGYEFEIKGSSDKAGFPGNKEIEGASLRKLLLKKGRFLKHVPSKGFRRKKTVRGNQISSDIIQVNLTVLKHGGKKLGEIFPDQNQKKEK